MYSECRVEARRRRLTIESVTHAPFILLSLAAMGLVWSGGSVHLQDHPAVVAAVILLLGVPHGGFDVALARRRWDLSTSGRTLLFLAAYVGLAGAVLVTWKLAAGLALPAFLVVSAFHFAGDWEENIGPLRRLIVGIALVTAPAVFHSADVFDIFCFMVPRSVAAAVTTVMAVIAVPSLGGSAVVLATLMRTDAGAALEAGMVLALATSLEPLAFFVIYFCGLHSIRHIAAVRRELAPSSLIRFVSLSFPYAPLAILATAFGGWIMMAYQVDPSSLGVVFLALAALTAPHMLLVEMRRLRP